MLTPFRLVAHFAGIVYPLYVLVGVAVLCGATMGLAGRAIGKALNEAVYPPGGGEGRGEVTLAKVKVEVRRRLVVRKTSRKSLKLEE
jgi:hypothetical protein